MEIVGQLQTYELVILGIVGVLVLFFGYRVKKIAFFLIWFVLGMNLVNLLMPTLVNLVPVIAENALWQQLLPIGGGLLLALLGFSIEKVCVGGISFALTMMATVQYFGTDVKTLAIGAVVGVIVAALAVRLMKPATIIATSAVGAFALTIVILQVFPQISYDVFYWPMIIGMTILGSLVQFMTAKHSS